MKNSTKAAKALLSPYSAPDFKSSDTISLMKAFNYFNYNYDVKTAQKWVLAWAKSENLDKNIISTIPKYSFSMTIGCVCNLLSNGTPDISGELREKVMVEIDRASRSVTPEVVETKKTVTNVISIQDRMATKVNEFLGEYVEGEIDEMITHKGKSKFELSKILAESDLAGKYGSMIADVYQDDLDLFESLLNGQADEQLKEAYPYSKAMLKRVHKFYVELIADANHYAESKKSVRKKRIKKAPTVEKQISKLQYQSEDKDLRLVSVNPSKILDARELWMYNTKYKKLICVTADVGGFGIKGTTINGMGNSEVKTLRKPEEVLKTFSKLSKPKLKKLMGTFKTKAKPFSGRMNTDIIILKCVK